MRVAITVDMEHDCPPYMSSYLGVVQGTPRLLALLRDEGVPATFFTTGDVARRFPEVVRAIVDAGHELGCHGDSHRRFGSMDEATAAQEIRDATRTLRRYAPVVSFRAPNLELPARFLPLLRAEGYRVDSSQGRHKQGSLFTSPSFVSGIHRLPASMSPSALRSPAPVRNLILACLRDPAIPFVHPWEFVDCSRWPIPLDCRIRTGDAALHHLRGVIRFYKRRGACFHRIAELAGVAADALGTGPEPAAPGSPSEENAA